MRFKPQETITLFSRKLYTRLTCQIIVLDRLSQQNTFDCADVTAPRDDLLAGLTFDDTTGTFTSDVAVGIHNVCYRGNIYGVEEAIHDFKLTKSPNAAPVWDSTIGSITYEAGI